MKKIGELHDTDIYPRNVIMLLHILCLYSYVTVSKYIIFMDVFCSTTIQGYVFCLYN